MHHYQAPLADMLFLLKAIPALENAAPDGSDLDVSDASLVLTQAAQFIEKALVPINQSCDQQGCRFEAGEVFLPEQMGQALKDYAAAGWMGLAMPEPWGGQGLSSRIAACIGEMLTSGHHAFSMISALNTSAIKALLSFGSDTLKQQYLPKMVSGEWLGCMSLTESHCGSDLGLIRCAAEAEDDGTYTLKGNKIFISAGAHDASDNIIHLVLARLKGAPEGVKGLSLFLVPSYLPDNEPSNGKQKNQVQCIGIEEKMGIHSNPTCSICYESAKGFLVGELNQGIKVMFVMMNEMRMGTALQGIGLSEVSYQYSLEYASERRQGRSLKGAVEPNEDADSLMVHSDVRRMLLTQRAFAEGGRALSQFCAQLFDSIELSASELDQPERENNKMLLNLLTPIAKAFCTETGLESSSLAIQVFGGHGYICESGVEQIYRDGRIATLYEGTTGIQALDLLGRKVLGTQGKSLLVFTKKLHRFCQQQQDNQAFSSQLAQLAHYTQEWPQLTQSLGLKAMKDHQEVGAAAYDYLMYSGYVTLAYFTLLMAVTAQGLLDPLLLEDQVEDQTANHYSEAFLNAKIRTAHFYFARLLPRADAHKASLQSGEATLAI